MLLNFGIGLLFNLLVGIVKRRVKKKSLSQPAKNGRFSRWQRIERAVLKFFHNEKWFFAKELLRFMCVTLTAIYGLLFFIYQITAVMGPSWLPYDFILRLFRSAYVYPVVTLIPLWQAYYFLSGVERIEEEDEDLISDGTFQPGSTEVDIDAVDSECRKKFSDYFRREIDLGVSGEEVSGTEHEEITLKIADGIAGNDRIRADVREDYLKCIDKLVRADRDIENGNVPEYGSGLVINGEFFSDFSAYFFRYISVILARGDNIVIVCGDDAQIRAAHAYVREGFSKIHSLYYANAKDDGVDYDDPIWKICVISDDSGEVDRARINDCSILITDPKYLCSDDFEQNHAAFSQLIDTVVLIDAVNLAGAFPRQLALFNRSIKNIRDLNELRSINGSGIDRENPENRFQRRYTSHLIKFVCFDNSRTFGIDKTLNNLLSVRFDSADAMNYSSQAVICCYDYDGKPDAEGRRFCPQLAKTAEELGVLANFSDFAVVFGGGYVSLFASGGVPYADILESIAANSANGMQLIEKDNFELNSPQFDSGKYKVIVAFDNDDNLPMTVRKYASLAPDRKVLVAVFSRPYMMRDYYTANIEKLWRSEQMILSPFALDKKQATLQKILVQASAGGISETELFTLLDDSSFTDYVEIVKSRDTVAALNQIIFDITNEKRNPSSVFEFDRKREFDRKGEFVSENFISLRKQGEIYDLLTDRSFTVLSVDNVRYLMPVGKERIAQNYIAGQNLLFNGFIYHIERIDAENGVIYARRVTGGKNNVPYRYIQDREYYIDWDPEAADIISVKKDNGMKSADGVTVSDITVSVTRRPMEVVTKGYYPVDQRVLSANGIASDSEDKITEHVDLTGDVNRELFKQTYRKYGDVKEPVCPVEMILGSKDGEKAKITPLISPSGAVVMSLKINGQFGSDRKRIASLASVMIGEIVHSMFPGYSDCVTVCPVFKDASGNETDDVLSKLPRVIARGYDGGDDGIELLIIEDCPKDIGVISALTTTGDNLIKLLFRPVYQYLKWYSETSEKSRYLYFGHKEEPGCFDFEGLRKLSALLGDDNYNNVFFNASDLMKTDVCDFCKRRFPKGKDLVVLEDGRLMCRDCAKSIAANSKKELEMLLRQAKIYLESTYGIKIDDEYSFCFESTVKIANDLKNNRDLIGIGSDVPLKSYIDKDKKVHIETTIPNVNISELLVRELSHVWQLKHLPELVDELAAGLLALVSVQYLRFAGMNSLANARATHFESSHEDSGKGYRELVRALCAAPIYRNNPFKYLLELRGGGEEGGEGGEVADPTPPTIGDKEFGMPYTAEHPDRALDGNITYFYYSRLTATRQKAYDVILNGIREFKDQVEVEGCNMADLHVIVESIEYDHPELFWFDSYSMLGKSVLLEYGAKKEEAEVLQRQIDSAVSKYLEGIDDSMSGYDVTIRLHAKIVAAVDYDTIALDEEDRRGGPKRGEIDYLRTICGVFLQGKAVCEGYARAIQYLLQKCGVECAEAAGNTKRESREEGGAHAWNILKLDGDYYYLDSTWDDSSDTVQVVKTTQIGFEYLNVTTEEMQRSRDFAYCPTQMPVCEATKCNYFYHNGYVLEKYDVEKVKAIAKKAAVAGASFFVFKCTNKAAFDEAFNKMIVNGRDCFDVLKSISGDNKSIDTSSYTPAYDKKMWTVTVNFKFKS